MFLKPTCITYFNNSKFATQMYSFHIRIFNTNIKLIVVLEKDVFIDPVTKKETFLNQRSNGKLDKISGG